MKSRSTKRQASSLNERTKEVMAIGAVPLQEGRNEGGETARGGNAKRTSPLFVLFALGTSEPTGSVAPAKVSFAFH